MKNIKITLRPNLISLALTILSIIFCLVVLTLGTGCKKGNNDLENNYSLVNADSKEYFIADIVGVEGTEKLNCQNHPDSDFSVQD